MGTPKALLEVDGQPLIGRIADTLRAVFPDILVVTGDERFAAAAKADSVPDIVPDRGVLSGLHTALDYFKEPVFCVACDAPSLSTEVLQYFAAQTRGADAWVPCIDGRAEPLHSLYAPSLLPVFARMVLREKPPPIVSILQLCSVRWLDSELRAIDPELNFLTNWNSPADLPGTVEFDRTFGSDGIV